MKDQNAANQETEGNVFVVLPTEDRKEAEGEYLIKLSPASARQLNLECNKYVAIVHDDKAVFGKLAYDKDLEERQCRIDQSIRDRIDVHEGDNVTIFPVDVGFQISRFVHPRSMILELHQLEGRDAEMNICGIHLETMELLGIEEGNYLQIQAVVKEGSKYRVRSISRRAFSRKEHKSLCSDQMKTSILLDYDARADLGIPQEVRSGVPIVVQADVWKIFLGRMIIYSISTFLGLSGLNLIVAYLYQPTTFRSKIAVLVFSALLSLFANMLLVIFDLRAKVQY